MELVGYQKDAVNCVQAEIDGVPVVPDKISYNEEKQAVIICVSDVSVKQMLRIIVDSQYVDCKNRVEERCFALLNQAEIEFNLKDELYKRILREKQISVLVAELNSMDLCQDLYGALLELITAR